MRASSLLLIPLLAFTPSCKPQIPNPVDVARVALDGSFLVLDETGRAVRAARRASAEAKGAPASGMAPGEAPPGSLPQVIEPPGGRTVDVRFSGEGGESQWLLQSGGRALCQTPCALRYPEGTSVTMVQMGVPRKPARLDLPFLRSGSYDAQARPRIMGAFAPGVVASAFGGMGTIAGLVLTAVGCSQSNGGMCRGGGVTLGVSGAVLAGGIVLLASSGARLRVEQLGVELPRW